MPETSARSSSTHGWSGLSSLEAKKRLTTYGFNELEKKRRHPWWRILLSQFTSPLIYILVVAALVTFFLHEVVDAIVIGLAVVVNTVLGFWQEFKAEKSLERLSEVLNPTATVMRDGSAVELPIKEVVPGDVILLESGDKIPADGVLVVDGEFSVNEAVLTGESIPVGKERAGIKPGDDLEKARDSFVGVEERKGNSGKQSVYAGTTVMRGAATMMAVHTGAETEIGKIAQQLSQTEEEETPLQKKLSNFSRVLAMMVGGIALLIFVVGLLMGDSFIEMFTLAVAVAVSAIPEGLVVALTAILAVGMQRILKRKALVRKLLAAEVLGSVSVICSDKTGTLTEGNLKVTKGELVDKKLALAAALSAADLKDPMEVAMYEWAEQETGKGELERIISTFERVDRIPFSSERKFSATLTQKELFIVGAPELLLSEARMSQKERHEWEEKLSSYAKKGYRLIGLAHRKRSGERKVSKTLLKKPWYWLGFLVYEDTIRRGVKTALKEARKAGISIKVITGDYKETAMEIMHQLGLPVSDEQVMEGRELEQISGHELDQRIGSIQLFARTSPSQKLKIVESLQRNEEVVSMSGDGVNDAPALKKADIGVVVSNASDVSKETADIVLLNDDFSTIVAAVEEGRGIFANLRKVLLYLLSDAFAEIIMVLGSMFVGLPLPITASQILWVNLANDGLPSLALTADPKDDDLLSQKPRGLDEPIVDTEIKILIGLISMATGLLILGGFYFELNVMGGSLGLARTLAFTTLSITTLLYVFSSRSLKTPIWRDKWWRNPWLIGAVIFGFLMQLLAIYHPWFQALLETEPLGWREWRIVFFISLIVIVIIEVVKEVFMHRMSVKKS